MNPLVMKAVEAVGSIIIERVAKKMLNKFFKKENKSHINNNYGLGVSVETIRQMSERISLIMDNNPTYRPNVVNMLCEIAQTETKSGTYWDKTKYAGMGLTQIDKIGFDDTIKRTTKANKDLILKQFGIDLNRLEWVELRHNPFICLLVTRLFLLLRKGSIPSTITERAYYWKKYYNTSAGKGTTMKYIDDVKILYT